MSLRSKSSNTTAANPLVLTAPTGIQDGDILTIGVATDAPGVNVSFPTGFSHVSGSPITCTADGQTLAVGQKVASGESGNYTVTSDGPEMVGTITCHSGRDTTTPIHRISNANQNTAQNLNPSMAIAAAAFGTNTTLDGCDLVCFYGADVTSGGDVSFTAPTNFTEQDDIGDTSFINFGCSTRDTVSAGQSGTDAVTATRAAGTSGWTIFMLALAPVAGASPGMPRDLMHNPAWLGALVQ